MYTYECPGSRSYLKIVKGQSAPKSPFANVQVFAMSEDDTDEGSSSETDHQGHRSRRMMTSNPGLIPGVPEGSPSASALSSSPSKCPHCTIHSWLPHSPQCPKWNNRNKKK